jgi:DMSO/TMAO reductase YedYZ heme-binding membrane subunit
MPLRPATRRILSILLVLMFAALPAKADLKNVLLVVPKAMGRTAVNMVTFRHRETALMQWVGIAAALADAETTRRSINRGSTEYNPFLGRRPSAGRTYATLLTVGFGYATMTQVIQDRVERPRPFTLGITTMAAVSHAYVAYRNTTICPGNMTCNVPAN